MAKKTQGHDLTGKQPTQKRSIANVKAILTAATQILERRGLDGFDTNRIAAEAGVGVGTLYQFFRSKEAILVAVARQQLDKDRKAIADAIEPAIDDPNAPIERHAIRAVIAVYKEHRRSRQLMMQAMIGLGLASEVSAPAREVAAALDLRVRRLSISGKRAVPPARLFIITCAIEAIVRTAAYEKHPAFGSQDFEDELVRLVRCFVVDAPSATR